MAEGGWGSPEPGGRFAVSLALGGGAVAVAALILAAATGEPYLGSDGVNGWIVVFAAALLSALIAFPFGLEVRLRERQADRDRRWELSLLVWGALSIGILCISLLVGFDTGTLAGTAALIAAIESAIVIATVVLWLLAGG